MIHKHKWIQWFSNISTVFVLFSLRHPKIAKDNKFFIKYIFILNWSKLQMKDIQQTENDVACWWSTLVKSILFIKHINAGQDSAFPEVNLSNTLLPACPVTLFY